MRKSIVSALSLSVLIAGGALVGGQAQTTPPSTQGTEATVSGARGAVGPGIGSGTLPGVGPPTGGLDSNPYAEAPPHVRKALGTSARAKQRAPAQSARGSVPSGSNSSGASSSQN
jgi:hypothetical protein